MSIQVSLNTTGQRLTEKGVPESRSVQSGFTGKPEPQGLPAGKAAANKGVENKPAEQNNRLAQSLNRKIDYQILDENNQVVIQIRDGETGELIRQIPQEEFIRLAERISEFNKNVLDEIA